MVLSLVVLVCISTAQAFEMEWVAVGNRGNTGELSGSTGGVERICGAVDYVYNIGTLEVTVRQYTEFLNAVAVDDTYGLYNTDMWDNNDEGCKIRRTGSPGSYMYLVDADGDDVEDPDWLDRPVNYVSWGDAARFCNWLHNGQPGLDSPVPQDENSTEDGSYYLNGATSDAELMNVVREEDATWVIPSEDEWYKAAYHYNDGVTGNYWDYPTGSNTAPTWEEPPGTDMTNGSANYDLAVGNPYYRTEVGAYDEKPSDSPYGTFDQGGNLSEWNEAVIHDLYRGVRGGSFFDSENDLRAAIRGYRNPANESLDVGFRVAYIPGPIPTVSSWGFIITALLGLVAGTVMFRRRQVA